MKNILQKIWQYILGPEHDKHMMSLPADKKHYEGFMYKGKEFIHHSELHHFETAFFNLIRRQKIFLISFVIFIVLVFIIDWHQSLVALFSVLTAIYFFDFLFSAFITYRTFHTHPEIKVSEEELHAFDKDTWPTYTIFCPLYKEWQVVPQFTEAMRKLDYPTDKLQILFLLEEDDAETIAKIKEAQLPSYFEIIVVPHSKPKTKPKAMNYGLRHARGEYIVIYDAEDVPEPDQLKKAIITFQKSAEEVVCVQAKLNFYNPNQNILTRVFTAEYSLWFDLVLPGLQSISAPIPLGGTSNHFRADKLRSLSGWDAFNVTEDCDLGMRLSRRGYRTAIVDSTTYEEANSDMLNWYKQRSRWIKGYIQTYFVHMRHPIKLIREGRGRDLFLFQFIVGTKIMSLFVNPVMWVTTAIYFIFRAETGLFIESLFPGPILYIGVFSFIFGNFLSLYYYMAGCAKRGYNDIIKYVFLIPFYWLGMSLAAWKAVYEIFVKPHYWHKTQHGLHLSGTLVKDVVVQKVSSNTFGFLQSGAGTLVFSSIVANSINFIFNAYLGRELTLEQFGIVTIISTFVYILSLFTSALSTTVTHVVSFLEGKHIGASNRFFRRTWVPVFITAAVSSFVWLLFVPKIAQFFQVESFIIIISFAPAIILGALDLFNKGYLQGTFNFKTTAAVILFEVVSKLAMVIALVQFGFQDFASFAIPASIALASVSSTIGALLVYRRLRKTPRVALEKGKFPGSFYCASFASGISIAAFLSIDVILAKHYLSPDDAGRYAMLSLVGKMIYFFGSLLNMFIVTVVSRAVGKGTSPRKEFGKIFAGTAFLTISGGLGLSLLGSFLVPLLLGEKARSIVPFVSLYATAMTLFTLSTTIVLYQLARKNYMYPAISLLMSVLMFLNIVSSHTSINEFVHIIFIINIIYFFTVALVYFSEDAFIYVYRNLRDIVSVFKKLPKDRKPLPGQARILIFNWRDIENSHAGGAETYIHALAKRWVNGGHSVTLFSGNDGKQTPNGSVDGVRLIRRGGFYGVYVAAFVYYFFKFRGKFDVIVDCENGVPFFTPLYVKEPVYCLIHHIHQEVFRKALVLPLAILAGFLEKRFMPLVYRHSNFITVSESSKHDMEALKITDKEIHVVHPGVDLEFLSPGVKSLVPIVSYVGRLKDYKSVDLLLRAFVDVLESIPEAQLVIGGDGDEGDSLKRLAGELGIVSKVSFLGKVTEENKRDIMRASWVFVNPSMMEGWGITTIEANACGTPVIASDVPGLRDSVRDGETGILVPYGKIDVLAKTIKHLLLDELKRETLSTQGVVWAANFEWQKSSDAFVDIILKPKFLPVNYKTSLVDSV